MREWKSLAGLGLALLALTATAAEAHTVVGIPSGWEAGLRHPISGVDHIIAMIAVGLIAGQHVGRGIWLIPGIFLAMMAVGGGLGISAVNLPLVELGIVTSVVVLAALVALHSKLPMAALLGLVGFFGVFHGYAHGAEMPVGTSDWTFVLGFVSATALLHALGIGFGRSVVRIAIEQGRSGRNPVEGTRTPNPKSFSNLQRSFESY